MGFGLCFGSIGIGKCDKSEPTSITFTNDETVVNNFLEQVVQTVSLSMDSNTSVSNDATIGKTYISGKIGKGATIDISNDVDQKADVKVIQTMNLLIKEILNSSEKADVKLDALATISQNSESSKILEKASAGATNISNASKTENISTTIKQLQTFLNVLAETSAKNNLTIEGIIIDNVEIEKGSAINYHNTAKQTAKAYVQQMIDLVNSSETCRNLGVTNQLISDIEAEQTAKDKGLAESITSGVAKIFTAWMIPIIGIVVVLIILILMVNLVKAFRVNRETKLSGGDDYYEYFFNEL